MSMWLSPKIRPQWTATSPPDKRQQSLPAERSIFMTFGAADAEKAVSGRSFAVDDGGRVRK